MACSTSVFFCCVKKLLGVENFCSTISQYASVEEDGEKFMSMEDYVCNYLQLLDKEWPNQNTVKRLAAMADTTKDE